MKQKDNKKTNKQPSFSQFKNPSTSKAKGYKGEDEACRYLIEQGQKIVTRNFKGTVGEVDIVSEANEVLIFTEVKSFYSYKLEEMEYAINVRKQQRIIQTAQLFMLNHPQYDNYFVRFDVVFLSGKTGELHHLINAFEGDGAPV